MDATFCNMKSLENYEDETYRDYRITYVRPGCIFYVSNNAGYRRGISSMRKDARRWIDLLIAGQVK
jgi:hypothetical protein